MSPAAQDAYADMLQRVIAPRLRALGFKGSGNSYVLPDDDRWLIVAFQKNRHSTAASVSFTVNLTAADKSVWAAAHAAESWVPARPAGNASYPWTDVVRLGTIAHGRDQWWQVDPDRSTDLVAGEVIDAIARFGLLWLMAAEPTRDVRGRRGRRA